MLLIDDLVIIISILDEYSFPVHLCQGGISPPEREAVAVRRVYVATYILGTCILGLYN